jgi:Tol biopolymer transport system component
MAYVRYRASSNLVHRRVDPLTHLTAEGRWLTSGTKQRWTPRVSPSGEWTVFTETGTRGRNLFLVPMDGGEPRQLTFEVESALNPAWSPDGNFIAYSANEKENSISVIAFEGDETREHPTAGDFLGGAIAWAPLQYIVYQQSGDQGFRRLDLAGAEDRALRESDHWMYDPCPSPDGTSLAYRGAGGPDDLALWVGNLPEGPFSRLNDSILGPVGWEPSGEAVLAMAVASINEVSDAIYRVPVDGGPPTLWYRFPAGEGATSRNVSITPDGQGFVAAVFQSVFDVVVVENPDPTVRR